MNILVSAPFLDRSGAPMSLLRLVRHLAERHRFTIVVRPGARVPLAPQFEAAGAPVVPRAAVPGNVDVVLAVTLAQSRAVRTMGSILPVLWWIHEPHVGRDLIAQHPEVADGFAAAARIAFVARWQAEAIYRPWLGATPWSVVPVGHEIDPTPMPTPFRPTAGALRLVHLGSYVARKGADVVLAALTLLDDPRIHVTFAGGYGDGNQKRRLAATIAADPRLADRTTFLGEVDEDQVRALLQHADGLVLPTRDDNLPLVVSEAMQTGCPVIATDLPPIAEAIEDGRTGLLVPVDDPPALARAIARLRDDPALRDRIAAAARAEAASRFALAPFVAAMERALHAAVAS